MSHKLRPCNLCNSDDVVLYLMLANGLEVLRCQDCGMIYVGNNPIKDEDLSSLYTMQAFQGERELQSKDWYKSYYRNCLAGYDPSSEVIREFLDTLAQIKRYVPAGRILDVGCATGVFGDLAKKEGYEYIGIDLSPELVEYARTHFGLDIRPGNLNEQIFSNQYFDIITMLDVVEHIPRYDDLFPELHRLLRPTGILLLRTPTEDAFLRNIAKAIYYLTWKKVELPLLWFYSFEHVNSFSKRTLSALVSRYGFRVIKIYDESETPERLDVPWIVKVGLRFAEILAAPVGRRHKIVLIAGLTGHLP